DALEKIAEIKPIYWVLHDMWMMTGGEAYTLDDNDYQTGNAKTPYAHYYPLCHPIIDRRQSYLEKKKQLWQKLAARITFIPVSHWLEGCLKSSYVYHPHLKIQTIPNGVDTTIFFDQHRRNWQKPRFLLFHTDNPFKGTPLAINALKKIDPSLFELYVVGKKIDGLGKQTIFERTNNRNLLNEYYNCVDVLIFPSLAENFPLTTLEAMATGVCVVASRVGGIEEQITEESGFLFERNNEESLFYVLQKLVELPIEVIRTKGMNAKSVVNSKFTKQIMEKSYKRVIEGF
ncbi:MAG: glycosyltransferase, partial [Flammeovirgaceae bacterium]|nr:glycosyltransferase [Flammeovirgaceae bacterium]MDW8287211.1 glycosyltransferase [Flammeovirgaceae bacterium]